MDEEWRDVVGYEGFYEVSNLGRVRNAAKRQGTRPGKIHCPRPYGSRKRSGECYWAVALRKNGTAKNFNVARLVSEAFIGPRPEGMEVNHKDDNKANNAEVNLEYVTPAVNKQKGWETGAYWHHGQAHPRAKLTDDQVRLIWSIRNDGYAEKDVADYFGVAFNVVGNIWRKRIWVHLLKGEPRDARTKLNRWSPRKKFKIEQIQYAEVE